MNFSGLTIQPGYFWPVPNLATTPPQARPQPTPIRRALTVTGAPANARLRYKRFIGHIPLSLRVRQRRIAQPPLAPVPFFDARIAKHIDVPPLTAPSPQMPAPDAAAESAGATIDRLFATAYAGIFRCTTMQARDMLRQNDQALYQSWHGLTNIDEITWTPATSSQPLTPLDLAFAAASFAAMMSTIVQPDADETAALGIAHYYLTQSATTVIENNVLTEMYQGVLQRGLHWIDVDKVRQAALSPAQILQTVCRYRRPQIATRAELAGRLTNYRDVLADEAALIHFLAQADCEATQAAPMHAMRARYASALIDEWQDISIGLALLPSNAVAPTHAKFWYDGVVLQNAQGKTIANIVTELIEAAPYANEEPIMQQLIDSAGGKRHAVGQPAGSITAQRMALTYAMHGAISSIPRYEQRAGVVNIDGAWLTRDEVHRITERALRDLKLNGDYPFGTPLNALATIVQRLGPLHGLEFSRFDQPAALMAAYNRLQRAWRDDPRFAVAPWLCAAHYLAKSSKVLFLDMQSSLSDSQQIARQVGIRLLPLTVSADYSIDLDYWNKTLENMVAPRTRRSFHFLIARLPRQAALRTSVQAAITTLREAPETIRYESADDFHQQLNNYLNERLRAQAPLPATDPDFLIEQILRQKLAMADHDLLSKRWELLYHSAASRAGVISAQRSFIKPLEEFKTLAAFSDAKKMTFGGRQIDAAQEFAKARASAAQSLADNPIVIAKSKEILRQNANVVTQNDAAKIGFSIAGGIAEHPEISILDEWLNALNYMFGSATVRMMVRSLASGEPRKILELLPFIVPLYDIEEGIRLADWRRARDGAIHFGEDAILTAIGMAAEKTLLRQIARDVENIALARSRMSSTERAGVDMMSELEDLSAQAMPERPVTVAEDTFSVHADSAQALTGPSALEALAASRYRLSSVKRHQMLFLIDEERSIAVTPISGGFAEIDRRGNVIDGTPMIFGDIESGRGYRLTRKSSPLVEALQLSPQSLLERETVAQIFPRWGRIAGLRNIRIRRENVRQIIQGLFALVESTPSTSLKRFWDRAYARYGVYAKFEQFWRETYASSDTAVVILNAASDNLIFRGQNEITFNAERAHTIGNNICLLGDKELADLQYASINGVTNFQRNRMWVHEALHALGKWKDASDSLNNRGGTVYLTERILWELDSTMPVQARLAYKIPPVFKDDEALHRAWSKNLFDLHDVAVAEDKILDRELDAGRDFSLPLMLHGRSIAKRITVRQGLALVNHIKSRERFYSYNVGYLFEQVAASFDIPRQSVYRETLGTFLSKSKTMRRLATAWVDKFQHARIKVKSVDFGFRERSQDRDIVGHSISAKTIWINSEALYYFSDSGLAVMSQTRTCAGSIIDFFLSEIIPETWRLELPSRWTNRGLGVLLENEVLLQIGDTTPPRICAELLAKPDGYLRHPTFVRRGADLEDNYLRQATRDGDPITNRATIAAIEDDILGLSAEVPPWSR
jgi:hypothetical protein